jgi:hypothetical protein
MEREVDLVKTRLMREKVMHVLESEGICNLQVINLLREMEMVDENGKDIWEENEDDGVDSLNIMDVMDSLPTEILPSAQEIYDMQIEGQGGFYILEATQRESQVVPSTEEIVVRAQNQTKNNISGGRKDKWG